MAATAMIETESNVEVSWFVPGRVLYTFAAASTEVMFERDRTILQLLEAEGKPPFVHLLIDCNAPSMKTHAPKIAEAITRFHAHEEYTRIRQSILRNPYFGWVITIGEANPRLQMTGKILSIKDGYRRYEAPSLEDALDFLRRFDPTLRNIL